MPNTYNPGFYYDLPAEEYFAIDAVSNSRLSLLKRSPLHYKVGRFKEPTKALALGSLVHAGVLTVGDRSKILLHAELRETPEQSDEERRAIVF